SYCMAGCVEGACERYQGTGRGAGQFAEGQHRSEAARPQGRAQNVRRALYRRIFALKAPPRRGFLDHAYSLVAEGSPVFRTKANPGTREMVPKWLDKKRPRRSGAKRQRVYRVLAEEGLPQQDNSGRAGSFQQERPRRSGGQECMGRLTEERSLGLPQLVNSV